MSKWLNLKWSLVGDAILMTDWNTVFTATLHFIYSIEIVDMTHKQMMNWTLNYFLERF